MCVLKENAISEDGVS